MFVGGFGVKISVDVAVIINKNVNTKKGHNGGWQL